MSCPIVDVSDAEVPEGKLVTFFSKKPASKVIKYNSELISFIRHVDSSLKSTSLITVLNVSSQVSKELNKLSLDDCDCDNLIVFSDYVTVHTVGRELLGKLRTCLHYCQTGECRFNPEDFDKYPLFGLIASTWSLKTNVLKLNEEVKDLFSDFDFIVRNDGTSVGHTGVTCGKEIMIRIFKEITEDLFSEDFIDAVAEYALQFSMKKAKTQLI
eukprot:TRINITY_DN5394_c0_g1_i3.p1 TRINITY_DN5394_c0_g1~~TRINITY_DN5394_c0_g1_i3.p1  ORF type:complete len:222 (+),score=39.02 TRINITY_DN5394_c0_g1_i3:30-668(+)